MYQKEIEKNIIWKTANEFFISKDSRKERFRLLQGLQIKIDSALYIE